MSGWLDDVLGGYLDRVGEREFDAAFLALLKGAGYSNVHLLHGAYEFGKDFIGRKDGVQHAFQTKAGDIGLAAWRLIRAQVEEMLWNDIAHPDFDAKVERRAVLVTTGRLVGGAAADAQQYSRSLAQRRVTGPDAPAPFEVWDREALLALMGSTPAISLNGWTEEPLAALLGLLADATRRQLTSRGIERATRSWVGGDLHRASLAAAVVGNRLAETGRPDLAVAAGCCLLRAAAVAAHDGDDAAGVAFDAGRRLVDVYASTVVEASAMVIEDPEGLVRVGVELFGAVGYRVRCSVMAESLGLLGLLRMEEGDADGAGGIVDQLVRFLGAQPGAAQPVSDRWAVSLIPPALLLRRTHPDVLVRWLEDVVVWVCDHHVRTPGLASVYAEPADEVRYLVGGPFEHVDLPRRRASYLATVLLDLAAVLELPELYRDAFNDFAAVDIATPVLEPLDEPGQYLFDGSGLVLEANVDFDEDHNFGLSWRAAVHHRRAPASYALQRAGRSWELLLVSMVLRDRHFLPVIRQLAGLPE